jgi:hypothetical protein
VNSALTIEKSPERAKRSESTPDPGSPGKVRRTRGAIPANRRKTPKIKSNGHDTGATRVNGHGPASPSRTAQETEAPLEKSRAASDDARDFPAAAAASSAAAGKERDACAEVALAPKGKISRHSGSKRKTGTGTSRVPGEKKKAKDSTQDKPKGKSTGQPEANSEKDMLDIPPGLKPLPADGAGFVDAMHEHVDLYQACARLVKSRDQKIAQRTVERLLEMKYGKGTAPAAEEAPEIVIDIDSAAARRAAQGAEK